MRNYRESYNMFCCCGILFNHESPRRGDEFVTQKVVKGAVSIFEGRSDKIHLGNMDARRDWGHAKDYVRGMHLMMQYSQPDDFVLATGVTRTIKELVDFVFSSLTLDPSYHVIVDRSLCRPSDVDHLCGDPTKAKNILGWEPEISFDSMIDEMIRSARTA